MCSMKCRGSFSLLCAQDALSSEHDNLYYKIVCYLLFDNRYIEYI